MIWELGGCKVILTGMDLSTRATGMVGLCRANPDSSDPKGPKFIRAVTATGLWPGRTSWVALALAGVSAHGRVDAGLCG